MSLPVNVNGVSINKIYVNGVEISKLTIDGNVIFGGDLNFGVSDAVNTGSSVSSIHFVNNVKSIVDFSLLTPTPYDFIDSVNSINTIRKITTIDNTTDTVSVVLEESES